MKKITLLATAMAMAAFTFAASSAQAEMKTEWVDYSQGGMKLKGYMAYDDSKTGKRPAMFVVPSRAGMSPEQIKLTEMWSKLGYIVFAADIFGYGQGILPKTRREQVAQTNIYRKDRALMKARTQAGFDTMLKNPMIDASKVALVGYCFGGDVGVEFGSTGAPLLGERRDPRLVREGLRRRLGEEHQGPVPDRTRRRGSGRAARGGRQGGRRTAQREGAVPARRLQRHRARLLRAEGQGRGARQHAVDRRKRAPVQGSVRKLSA